MSNLHRLVQSSLVALPVLVACGPKLPDANQSGESSTSSSTNASTTNEGSETAPETETSDASSGGFAPDIPPPPEDCDIWQQDCRLGQKCVPWVDPGGMGWLGFLCVPVLGNKEVGASCTLDFATSTDDCNDEGSCFSLALFSDDPEPMRCRRFCEGSADDPSCASFASSCLVGNGYPGPGLCLHRCDPLAQDCPEDEACVWLGSDFACSPRGPDHLPGEPCSFLNECTVGGICTNAPVPGCEGACCTLYCDPELGDAGCAELPGTQCEFLTGFNGGPVGICTSV